MYGLRLAALLGALFVGLAAPAAAQGTWGALAFSENGTAYAYSRNYPTKEQAEQGALNECAKYAADCKIYDTFENRCTALAGSPNGVYGWAWGGEKQPREARAVQQCTSQGGTDCRLVITFCTGSASDGEAPGPTAPQPEK